MMNRKTSSDGRIAYVTSPELMPPAGHYSHACVVAGMAYVSGQLPIDNSGTPLSDHAFEIQAKQVLANLDACLAAAGTDRSRLVQVRVYVTDMAFL